jgi:hypothetical protein
MKPRNRFAFFTACLAFTLVLFTAAYAVYADAPDKLIPYKQIATVEVPSGLAFPGGGFDISWVDSTTGRYYLADRGNTASTPTVPPGVDVLETKHPSFLYEIPLPDSGGTNGVVAIHSGGDDPGDHEGLGVLVVGGTNSKTYFIDLAHPFLTPLSVSTGGNKRADELAYDPRDQIILIANPDEIAPNHPFVTFISTANHTVLGKIIYDGASGDGPAATGIEQPVWDRHTGKFYIAIPATAARKNGEIDEIDPLTRTITRSFPTTCGPAGLAQIPGQRLITSCGDVLDIDTGNVVTTFSGVAADEIWYNPGDQRVYFGDFINTPVVNGVPSPTSPSYQVIATLPWMGTPFSPPPPVFHFTHSVAADSVYNHIFVPVSNSGVLVFTDDNDFGNEQK